MDPRQEKDTMDAYRVPGTNRHGRNGHWAVAELWDVYSVESECEARLEIEFNQMIQQVRCISLLQTHRGANEQR